MSMLSLWRYLALVGALFAVCPTAIAQPERQVARLLVVNADELAAAGPDTELAEDLCRALDDWDSQVLNRRHNDDTPSAADLALLLISLGSPEEINRTARYNEGFAVGPVTDFNRFVEAIDYGRVLARDDRQWIIKIKIDPEEVDRNKLIARAQSTGRRPVGLDKLRDGGRRKPKITFPKGAGGLASSGPSLGDGDLVETQIGALKIEGEVKELDDEAALVQVSDISAITKKLTDARLKGRLRRAEGFAFWTPTASIRVLRAAATKPAAGAPVAVAPRTWTDTTGRFEVVATYGGVSGDKVRLAKSTGAEVLVPLNRLSEADREYVAKVRAGASSAAPIEVAAPPVAQSLSADWSSARPVEGKDFDAWSFVPPKAAATPSPSHAKTSLTLETPPEVGSFGEELTELFVAKDGGSAIALIEDGETHDEKLYLQYLDFRTGKAEPLVAIPDKSLVLDALPEERLVLLRPNIFGRNDGNGRLFVQRLQAGKLMPMSDWMATPPESFFKTIESASFLADGGVLTRFPHAEGFAIWSRKDAKAKFTVPIPPAAQVRYFLDPSRRYLGIASNAAVSLIDTITGEHVATVMHSVGDVKAVGMNEDMTRLAVWTSTEVAAWDLATGEPLFRLAAPNSHFNDSLDWVGDLLLVGGKYLIDAPRRIILWQYEVASSGREQHVLARAGRLFYAPKSERGLSLYVASIPAPHDAVAKRRSELGSPDKLLIAKPGDAVFVTVETDRGVEVEKQLQHSIEASLKSSGYRVVEKSAASADALEATVICRALPQQVVRINMSSSPFPDAWDIVERTITPYVSRVALRHNNVELWSDGWRAEPGHVIWINDGETLDEALNRLTSPDIDRLLQVQFASHLARPGNASPEGAYGASRLTVAGVVTNQTGD